MRKRVKLTGHESSILAHIAQRPSAYYPDTLFARLSPEARSIASYIMGEETDSAYTQVVRSTGDAILDWAAQRRARELSLLAKEEP